MGSARGITGAILRVNLTTGTTSMENYPEEFYRSFLGGGGFGTWFLLKETLAETDALAPENVITIAPGLATGAAVAGLSRCSVTALSPETGAVGDSQAGGNLGPYLKRAGFDAVVVVGKAKVLSYISIHDGTAEIIEMPELSGTTVLECYDRIHELLPDRKLSIVQCGPAGENLVRFSTLASDLNNTFGRTGMGAVFGSKNLRAIVVEPTGTIEYADPDGMKEIGKKGTARVMKEGVAETLRKHGTPGIVTGNAKAGNLSTHNYSSGFHPEYKKLDGAEYDPKYGSKGTTCYGCPVGCRKTVKIDAPYEVSDRMGGPEFETIGVFGSNLDITDITAISRANELCNLLGIDTITMGGLASYLCESLEQGAISSDQLGIDSFGFGKADGLFRLISQTAVREGIGDVIADGFPRTVARFGEETGRFAVHVKNHGFAVHMPQVKPSMALLYAVSPIGADHMSSEHDWLAMDKSEASRGLGFLSSDTAESYGPDKLRAITYSQFYFAVLDSLGLCMFVWGPGSVYSYSDLENMIRAATGWEVTLWELMKAGERRITMMRMLNNRRGFTVEHDKLPEKMFVPLKGGPSDGRHVDRAGFEFMRTTYYGIMGWNSEGEPTEAKLHELDLAWTIDT